MFEDENKMIGLSCLYVTSDMDMVLSWGKEKHGSDIQVSEPDNGVRSFYAKTKKGEIQRYPEIIIQENRKYKIYG